MDYLTFVVKIEIGITLRQKFENSGRRWAFAGNFAIPV